MLFRSFAPEALFAEDQGLYIVTLRDHALLGFLAGASAAGIAVQTLGRTAGTRLIFELAAGDHCVPLADLRRAHEGFFPKLMGGDAEALA